MRKLTSTQAAKFFDTETMNKQTCLVLISILQAFAMCPQLRLLGLAEF